MEQRTQVNIQCPLCHGRQFLEIEVEEKLLKSPLAREIQGHLEAWLASRCPDHLGAILNVSKN